MTSGTVTLAMPRAQVTVDGVVVAKSATVTVQGGQAVAVARGENVELRMAVANVERRQRNLATVVGTDGTVWSCQRRRGG